MVETVYMKHATLILIMGIAVVFGAGFAEGAEKAGTFSFYFENDLFANTDRHYTNDIKLPFVSPDLTGYAENGRQVHQPFLFILKSAITNRNGVLSMSFKRVCFIFLHIIEAKLQCI